MKLPDESIDRAVQVVDPPLQSYFSLEEVAGIVGINAQQIMVYCQRGWIISHTASRGERIVFNDEDIRRLRLIEYLRRERGMNDATIKLILELMSEIEQLRAELRVLRQR